MRNKRWNPTQPLIELPDFLRLVFQEHANLLYSDLNDNRLSIVLAEPPNKRFEGHKIRIIESFNPEWYSNLWRQYYPNLRRDRTLKTLDRLRTFQDQIFIDKEIGCVPYSFYYDTLYRGFIFENLTEGFVFEGVVVSPLEKVIEYFL